jgi:hypothetical protein
MQHTPQWCVLPGATTIYQLQAHHKQHQNNIAQTGQCLA